MTKSAALAALLLSLPGCAVVGYSHMTPEQIQAMAKDSNADLLCIHAVTNAGTVRIVQVGTDKGATPRGTTVTVKADTCDVTVGYAHPAK